MENLINGILALIIVFGPPFCLAVYLAYKGEFSQLHIDYDDE